MADTCPVCGTIADPAHLTDRCPTCWYGWDSARRLRTLTWALEMARALARRQQRYYYAHQCTRGD